MRIYDVANALIEKFSPLPKKDAMELGNEAAINYHKVLKTVEEKQVHNAEEYSKKEQDTEYEMKLKKLSLLERLISFTEQWWCKYILAVLYIFLVRKIQNFLLSDSSEDVDDDDRDADEFAEYMKFKRMRGA